jgi:5-methylcytosine-specific restriction protein A
MPTINLKLKEKKTKTNERNQTDARKVRQKAYNNTNWRKLRDTYLKEHAVCQDCIAKGRVTPAQDVHHIKSPFKNGEVNYNLLLDYTNLVSLCKECHAERHNKDLGNTTVEEIIKQLDKLFEE